jgi:hypothetical protein
MSNTDRIITSDNMLDWLNENGHMCIKTCIPDGIGGLDCHWEIYDNLHNDPIGYGRSIGEALTDAMKDVDDPSKFSSLPPQYSCH